MFTLAGIRRNAARLVCGCLLAACGGDSTGPSSAVSITISGAPIGPVLDGAPVQLIASPVNSSGAIVSNVSVQWSSSDPTIATVNGSGAVLPVGAGLVTIMASSGQAHGSAVLDVRAGGVVTPAGGTLNMLNGAVTLSFPASAVPASITVLLGPTASPPANSRLIPGTAFDIAPTTQTFITALSMTMRYDPQKLPTGVSETSLQLYTLSGNTWTVLPSSSVNTSTKIVSGFITRLGTYAIVGTAVDHVALGGLANGALYVGQSGQILATEFDAQNNLLKGRSVTWSSSDPSRASVDSAGNVQAVAPGQVTITATSEGKAATTTLSILARVVADWSQVTAWTTFQGNAAHTGYVPVTVDPFVFKERWVASVAPSMTMNAAITGNGTVFVSSTGYFSAASLYALDITNGSTRWSQAVGSNQATMPPVYADGFVYMQTNDITSYLWGFDATSGSVKFRVQYASQWSVYLTPVVIGQTIYMGCGEYDGLCAQRVSDGTNIWFASTNQYDGWTPAVLNGVVYTYTGDYSPNVTATDAATGKTNYQIPDPHFNWNGWTMGIAPVLGGMNDLVATQNNRLVSFNLAAKTVGWEKTGTFSGQPAVANGTIYVTNNGQLEAHNETDGSLAWVWIPPEGKTSGPMIVTNNLVFIATAANTYAVDLTTKKQIWSYPASGRLVLSDQGVLIISRSDGKVSAITVR